MMGPIASLLAFTIRQTLSMRRAWMTLLVLAGPAVLLIAIRCVAPAPDGFRGAWTGYHVFAQIMLVSLIVPMVCMVHGVALIGVDVDARTIGYLTTRRLRRGTVLVVKFIGTALVLAALCEAAMLALHAVARTALRMPLEAGAANWDAGADLRCYLLIIPLAVVGFLAVFTLIGLLSSRPLGLAVVYLIVVELIVSNIPAPVAWYTLSYYLRALAARMVPRLFELYEVPTELRATLYPPDAAIWPVPVAVAVVALAVSAWLVTVRELVPVKVARE